jgi:aminopeptidase N
MWWIKIILILQFIIRAQGSIRQRTNNTFPIKYEIFLHTEIHDENFKFNGYVTISFRMLEESNTIQLDQKQLTISDAALLENDEVMHYYQDNENELLIIGLNESSFQMNKDYNVKIDFSGTFHKEFTGFYEDEESETKFWFLALSFHVVPAYAVFPSINDYGSKSIFEFIIEHHQSYNALSNADKFEVIEGTQTAYKKTQFVNTDPLAISCLSIFVSNFESIPTLDEKIEFYGRKALIEKNCLDDALATAENVSNLFKNYFSLTYELPKIKIVAIPGIIAEKANFGLIFYNEQDVIYNSNTATTWKKDEILQIMCRGFAVSLSFYPSPCPFKKLGVVFWFLNLKIYNFF